jgi:hypothetical protein
MKLLITGHRQHKLIENGYNVEWIENAMFDILSEISQFKPLCFSGMANGIDLMFCQMCALDFNLPYIACIPFEEQGEYMTPSDRDLRQDLIAKAKEVKNVKNSWMVEHADTGIAVWDGNKGGTHNVVQQLIEQKKNFFWINPVSQVVWKCFI